MSRPIAIHLPARSAVKFKIGEWEDEFSVERLPGWIRFYQSLCAGKSAKHYQPSLHALLAVQQKITGATQ